MISEVLPPAYSGAGSQALRLAEGLARRGVSVLLIGERAPGTATYVKHGRLRILRLPGANSCLTRRTGRAVFYSLLSGVLMALAPRYDVIHVHGVFGAAIASAIVSKALRKPLVLKMTRSGDDDIRTLSRMEGSRRITDRLRAFPLRVSSMVVAVNSDMLEGARESGYPPSRVILLPNAVDTAIFRPPSPRQRMSARARFGLHGWVILFAGGMVRHKGLHPLVRALAKALDEESDLTLAIAGPTDQTHPEIGPHVEAETMELIRQLGLGSKCSIFGLLDSKQMRDLYWASDLFVSASTREGAPNALLEALACGLPSTMPAIPAMRSLAEEYANLPRLDPEDPADIAQAILQLRRDPSRDASSKACRTTTVALHSFDRLEKEYVSLYSGLLSGRSCR